MHVTHHPRRVFAIDSIASRLDSVSTARDTYHAHRRAGERLARTTACESTSSRARVCQSRARTRARSRRERASHQPQGATTTREKTTPSVAIIDRANARRGRVVDDDDDVARSRARTHASHTYVFLNAAARAGVNAQVRIAHAIVGDVRTVTPGEARRGTTSAVYCLLEHWSTGAVEQWSLETRLTRSTNRDQRWDEHTTHRRLGRRLGRRTRWGVMMTSRIASSSSSPHARRAIAPVFACVYVYVCVCICVFIIYMYIV